MVFDSSSQGCLNDFFPSSFIEDNVEARSLFCHPLRAGWLLPYLVPLDGMFTKRYDYFFDCVVKGKLLNRPIPWIDFSVQPSKEAVDNILDCVGFAENQGFSDVLPDFVSWVLWGLKSPFQKEFPSRVSDVVSGYWYRTFNLGLLLKFPADYFLHLSTGLHLRGNKAMRASHHKARGYFATPPNVAKMMTEMAMGNKYSRETAGRLVLDPCGGTGIFSLCASNYSMNLCYVDIDPVLALYARLNFHLYVPWMIYPCFLRGMKNMARNRTVVGDALIPVTNERFGIVRWKDESDE